MNERLVIGSTPTTMGHSMIVAADRNHVSLSDGMAIHQPTTMHFEQARELGELLCRAADLQAVLRASGPADLERAINEQMDEARQAFDAHGTAPKRTVAVRDRG